MRSLSLHPELPNLAARTKSPLLRVWALHLSIPEPSTLHHSSLPSLVHTPTTLARANSPASHLQLQIRVVTFIPQTSVISTAARPPAPTVASLLKRLTATKS
ncbi:hypothetical protein PspLS_08285 [Pyricularia sp. CBS 133598]|nr:hypothetical protein PspLS_08285 [Pyricularia sp. CBS 133598]